MGGKQLSLRHLGCPVPWVVRVQVAQVVPHVVPAKEADPAPPGFLLEVSDPRLWHSPVPTDSLALVPFLRLALPYAVAPVRCRLLLLTGPYLLSLLLVILQARGYG